MNPNFAPHENSGSDNTRLDYLKLYMRQLGLDSIPLVPPKSEMFQRGGSVKVPIAILHCSDVQNDAINKIYAQNEHFIKIFDQMDEAQLDARCLLGQHNLVIEELEDLGNGWSRRWSSNQSGMSSVARKAKVDKRKLIHGESVNNDEWKRKMPYDFTGCLAHLDITYTMNKFKILRITGIIKHVEPCKKKLMTRIPPVPLHPHVIQVALEQINQGASLGAIQKLNQQFKEGGFYHGQDLNAPSRANFRYTIFPADSQTLYHRQVQALGMDTQKSPEINIDNWLSPGHYDYKQSLSLAIFYYKPRTATNNRFKLCIQTEEMK
ncbi:hypothetical protein Clacol_006000 [Clathrus columnatus]|uniref:PAZ domain-containing protein n=1 Tax=Clathrus columnatus TaxID=1419009 RepID=A0AAV5AAU6_9AGAM|nr:hypothetical protein Clacol_006000 [Clathrus columnatus]